MGKWKKGAERRLKVGIDNVMVSQKAAYLKTIVVFDGELHRILL